MNDKNLAQQIAVLGRLCGITPGYQDNQGKRRRTSQATYKALLTAMGVPWGNADVLRREIERRQERLFDRLLQPVTVISSPGVKVRGQAEAVRRVPGLGRGKRRTGHRRFASIPAPA